MGFNYLCPRINLHPKVEIAQLTHDELLWVAQ